MIRAPWVYKTIKKIAYTRVGDETRNDRREKHKHIGKWLNFKSSAVAEIQTVQTNLKAKCGFFFSSAFYSSRFHFVLCIIWFFVFHFIYFVFGSKLFSLLYNQYLSIYYSANCLACYTPKNLNANRLMVKSIRWGKPIVVASFCFRWKNYLFVCETYFGNWNQIFQEVQGFMKLNFQTFYNTFFFGALTISGQQFHRHFSNIPKKLFELEVHFNT